MCKPRKAIALGTSVRNWDRESNEVVFTNTAKALQTKAVVGNLLRPSYFAEEGHLRCETRGDFATSKLARVVRSAYKDESTN